MQSFIGPFLFSLMNLSVSSGHPFYDASNFGLELQVPSSEQHRLEKKNDNDYRNYLPALAQHPFNYTFHREVNGQRIDVALELKVFYPNEHRLETKNGIAYIDGATPIGTDNSFTVSREFARFEVSWNGKFVNIPKRLYSDLFNASLRPKKYPDDNDGSVWTSVSADANSLLIEFFGSEAAGAYKVWLIIQRDGRHLRFIEKVAF